MTTTTDEVEAVPQLARVAGAVLESLYQHRLLTTNQIHALHTPHSSKRWTQLVLADLRKTGLIACSARPGGLRLWYVTERGAEAVETIPNRAEPRRKLLHAEQAAGALRAHTRAVNDVGVAFVQAARERGDECGWFAWRHEIAHPLGRAPGGHGFEQVIADALLSYQQNEPDGATSFHYRFVELDRATMQTERLASKLVQYARLYTYAPSERRHEGEPLPLWTRHYPVYPTVLLVLDGKPRAALEQRRRTVLGLGAKHRELRAAQQVQITCCLLADLAAHGPFAAIFRTLADPTTPADWLGAPGEAQGLCEAPCSS